MYSTTTSRTTPSPTCTGSDAPAGPAGRETRCCSSHHGSATCSRRSKRPPASRLPRSNCPPSRTSTRSGSRNSPIPSPTRSAPRGWSCSAAWSRTTNASMTSRWPTSPRRWRCSPATARRSCWHPNRRGSVGNANVPNVPNGPNIQGTQDPSPPTASRWANVTRSARAPSSAPLPTRGACTAAISATSPSDRTSHWWSCRPSSPTRHSKSWKTPASRAC